MFAPLDDVLADLRAGRMIVLVDDENRENEGDLVCAAECVTPEVIRFMTRHTPGYLCLALTAADCERLALHPQAGVNTSLRGTAMAVSIDGHPRHGVGTGISASDRARTVRIAVDPASRPEDLVRPGHMVPLRARDGGVLVRTGQTEGSVDLCRLAGLRPAAVISEVCRDDGEMARLPDLQRFCAEHGLKLCSVEQIIEHRLRRERLVERIEPRGGVPIDTPYGRFQLIAYQTAIDPLPHLALTVGGIGELEGDGRPRQFGEPVLVRVHRRDLLGDVFEDLAHPTARELRAALVRLHEEGRGALVYLRPEAAGSAELRDRLQRIRRHGVPDGDAPDLTHPEGVGARAQPMDEREFGVGAQILLDLGLSRLRLLTNHRKTLPGLHAFGVEVVEQVPIEREARGDRRS